MTMEEGPDPLETEQWWLDFSGPTPRFRSPFRPEPRPPPPRTVRDACRGGNLDEVIMFFEKEPPTTEMLAECFEEACENRSPEMLNYLLRNGAEIDNLHVDYVCSEVNSVEVFAVLLEHGWDINSEVGRVRSGRTALSYVLHNEELVKWFLARGADPGLGPPDTQLYGPLTSDTGFILDRAATSASICLIDLLVQHGARIEKSYVLQTAASQSEDRTQFMADLLTRGADINKLCRSFYLIFYGTPLDQAIRANNVKHVQFLLERGADLPSSLDKRENANTSMEMLQLLTAFSNSRQGKKESLMNADC